MSYQPTIAQPSTLPKTGKVSSRRKGSSNPPVMLRSYADPRTSQDALERPQMVRFAQRSITHTCRPSADRSTRLAPMPTTTSILFIPIALFQLLHPYIRLDTIIQLYHPRQSHPLQYQPVRFPLPLLSTFAQGCLVHLLYPQWLEALFLPRQWIHL